MSCNGCRVLRKGCSDSCILRPCLQWIEGAEAQGHATVFVAKFFGRAGLMNFISAVPETQRPALFQSLLFEACGRTVNPVFGAVGLLWSGNWNVCQAAVETVLKGGSLQPLVSALRPCQALPSMNIFSSSSLQQPPPPYSNSRSPDSVLVEALNSQQQQQQQLSPEVKPRRVVQQAGSVKRELPSPPLIAPVPRRIRPRLQGDSLTTDEVGAIDLDLSLGFHSKQQEQLQRDHHDEVNKRVHSPCQSVTSEGSVTSVDTAELKISLRSS